MFSQYTLQPFNIDDIVTSMDKKEWNTLEALLWQKRLEHKGIVVRDVIAFYKEVMERFDTLDAEMHAAIPSVTKALERVCICQRSSEKMKIIHLETEKVDHELMELHSFYCPTCNSFWREP